jgi:hypothetical protein
MPINEGRGMKIDVFPVTLAPNSPVEDVKVWLPQLEENYSGVEELKVSLVDGVATLKGNAKFAFQQPERR